MYFTQIRPSSDLAHCIRHFWIMRDDVVHAEPHPILPDGSAELVFNMAAPMAEVRASGTAIIQPHTMLVGQQMRPMRVRQTASMYCVGVKLAPWGVTSLFGFPKVVG